MLLNKKSLIFDFVYFSFRFLLFSLFKPLLWTFLPFFVRNTLYWHLKCPLIHSNSNKAKLSPSNQWTKVINKFKNGDFVRALHLCTLSSFVVVLYGRMWDYIRTIYLGGRVLVSAQSHNIIHDISEKQNKKYIFWGAGSEATPSPKNYIKKALVLKSFTSIQNRLYLSKSAIVEILSVLSVIFNRYRKLSWVHMSFSYVCLFISANL